MLKPIYSLLSPAGSRARLNVFIFHRVHAVVDPLFPDEVDAARFDAMLGWLKAWFDVLPLDEAIARLQAGSLPARAAALTFDDGYADNHDVALPLLQQHGLPCSFFVATGFLDGGRMWNDTVIEAVRRCTAPKLDLRGLTGAQGRELGVFDVQGSAAQRATLAALIPQVKYLEPEQRQACVAAIAERTAAPLPEDLMMTSEQVRALRRAGMLIGAHTVSHPILATLSRQAAGDEIERSRSHLQGILGEPVTLFAYPNGKPGTDYLPEVHPQLVRELGFAGAVSTQWGASRQGDDPYQVKRFTPWDRGRLRFGVRLVQNLLS
jgi:peptidoglycan/xylan/chitin deacetylase (PgdA/CDA1 family)